MVQTFSNYSSLFSTFGLSDGIEGFAGPGRVLNAPWAYNIVGILKLLRSLQDILTDGLVGFTGPDKVLQDLTFGLTSFRKPVVWMNGITVVNLYKCLEKHARFSFLWNM